MPVMNMLIFLWNINVRISRFLEVSMIYGIAMMGLNGAGKSTLAHALSKHLGYYEMDVEDYYFPEQKSSRQYVLDHATCVPTEYLGELPFSSTRSKSEVEDALRRDIASHPQFVLSGVTMNWSNDILSAIKIAFLVETPLEVRLKRIQEREIKRFGIRVLPGGNMYGQQCDFCRIVAEKDDSIVYKSAQRLQCPVIILDGTEPIDVNIQRVMTELSTNG